MGSFNAAMLTVARQMRGFSQTELAKALRISQGKISKIEAGIVVPDDALVQAMGHALKFRPHFFKREGQMRPAQASYHRKRKKLTGSDWDKINAKAELYRFSIESLLRSVDLVPTKVAPPKIDPDQYDGKIDRIAASVRQAWMLPRGPVSDVVKTIAIDGALERIVNLSSGARSAADYLAEVTVDTLIHTWDLARAIGDDERLDDRLVRQTLVAKCAEDEADFRLGGDDQSTLLSLFGRTP